MKVGSRIKNAIKCFFGDIKTLPRINHMFIVLLGDGSSNLRSILWAFGLESRNQIGAFLGLMVGRCNIYAKSGYDG